jgi:hypothetical protein
MVGAVFRMAEADKLPPVPDRQEGSPEGQILGMAQNLLGFGEQNHAEATGRQPSRSVLDAADALLSAYRGEADRRFRQVALRLVSTNGLLTDRPYAFDDDEFVGD